MTFSALTGHWPFLSPLHRSFPEADIDPLAQHFDVLYGGIADKTAGHQRAANGGYQDECKPRLQHSKAFDARATVPLLSSTEGQMHTRGWRDLDNRAM